MRATRDSIKDDGRVMDSTVGPDDRNCEESCDESVESEASKAGVITEGKVEAVTTATTFTDSLADCRTAQNSSSIMYTKKAILFYFLLSSSFAIILSFWIL